MGQFAKKTTKAFSTIMIVAFVFVGSGYQAKATGLWTISNLTGDQDGEGFGFPVRFIGDVNGDGVSDVAVGSDYYNIGSVPDVGRVQIFSGANGAKIREHTMPFTNTASPSDYFGSAFTGIGDVNGDGRADYAILDPDFSTGEGGAISNMRGRILAYSGIDGSVLWTYKGAFDYQFQFGNALMMQSRDFNGDGKRDIAVGAPGMNDGQTGAILILDATNGSVLTQYNGTQYAGYVGMTFDTGFDINNDGTEDFIVGEPFTNGVEVYEGAVRVISGVNLASPTTIFTKQGPSGQRFALMGIHVLLSGDTNNDGRPDFAASSRETIGGLDNAGAVRVFSGVDASQLREYDGSQREDVFGNTLARAGTIENNGYNDIAVSSLSGNGAGQANVYASKADIKWDKIPGGAAGEAQGSDVSGGTDVNGDGVPDMVLGSTGGQVGSIFPGRARIVRGDPTNVPAGANIEVHPEINKTNTSLIFPTVTTSGNITFTYLNQTATGANFRTKQAAKSENWTMTANAVFSGTVTACLKYNQAVQNYDETKIDIQHFEGGAWVTKTTTRDAVNDTVCGTVTSL